MKEINNLSKSDNYLKTLELDKLTRSIKSSLRCPPKIATAMARLVSSKIYLELVLEEESHYEYLNDLDQLMVHHVKETLH